MESLAHEHAAEEACARTRRERRARVPRPVMHRLTVGWLRVDAIGRMHWLTVSIVVAATRLRLDRTEA